MHPVHIFELGADGVYLAEAVHGFLEHDSDLFPAQLPQRSGAACEQVGFVEPDVPGGFTGFFREQAQKGVDHCGFARAGFTDDAKAVPSVDAEGDAVHCPDVFVLAVIDHAQIFYIQLFHTHSYFLLCSLGFMA